MDGMRKAQYNADRWVGIAADFGGRYGTPIIAASDQRTSPDSPNRLRYSFLAGPVVSYRTKSRVTPFVHVLVGWDRTSLGASTITGSVTFRCLPPPLTYNDFALALGGGVDFKIVAARFLCGWDSWTTIHTSLNLNKFYRAPLLSVLFQGHPTHQVNLRFSAGIVVRF